MAGAETSENGGDAADREAPRTESDRGEKQWSHHASSVRQAFALEQLVAEGVRPATVAAQIIAKFGVARSTAYEDLKAANAEVRRAIEALAPHLGAQVKDQLARLARVAEKAGDYKAAVQATTQLGKFLGMSERSEGSIAAELPAEQLTEAIGAAIEERVTSLSDADLEALLARRAAARSR